ncbi:MAG: cation transporter [Ruminococcus flavefaciens]|nr:cation transporter [Ruminococcus flavefaciens]MCM1229047.1 cation transporter [Ruminococcus flavefaciens]
MENFIIIGIIIIVIAVGIYSTVKHFKGESGCCGGGGYKPRRKKLSHVIYTKTFSIDGMHCEHCKNRVEEIVNDIDGTAGRVDLKKGELKVSYEQDVADEIIRSRIEKVGYVVTGITKD